MILLNRIYIIVPTKSGIGGAEKRFFGLWAYLVSNSIPAYFVSSKILFNSLVQTQEAKSINIQYNSPNFLEFDFALGYQFSKSVKQFIKVYKVEKKDILHFILEHPIARFSQKTLFSCTISGLRTVNTKGVLLQFISVAASDYSDILDPWVHRFFSIFFFIKRGRITRTSNSFTYPEVYKPGHLKENIFTFCGKFVKEKQIISFVKSVPVIVDKFVEEGLPIPEFHLIGEGPQENEISTLLMQAEYQTLKIYKYHSLNLHEALSKSKIFFSLQLYNNYPSKSLIEAMSAGNTIIATDCGDTSEIVRPEFSELIPTYFNAVEIANATVTLYKRIQNNHEMGLLARSHIIEKCSLEKMAEYYLTIYSRMNKVGAKDK